MSKDEKTISEHDVSRLLSLKAFERPSAGHIEKRVQITMQAVRAAHYRPSLHLFPDKRMAWMFAQPRYGIAALFILFFGLNLMTRPVPVEPASSIAIEPQGITVADLSGAVDTNRVPVPSAIPAVRPNYSSLIRPVSFTENR